MRGGAAFVLRALLREVGAPERAMALFADALRATPTSSEAATAADD